MAAYTKAWVVPWDHGRPGIAFVQPNGVVGVTSFNPPYHPDLLELITMLSDADLLKIEGTLTNGRIPFNRSKP